MEVICLQDEALKVLIDKVVAYVKAEHGEKNNKWLTPDEAMQELGITSKATFQKYRDEGNIRYCELSPRKFMYDRNSIEAFKEKKSRDTF